MIELKANEIVFEAGSVVDPVGKVFHFDGRVFRGISGPYVDHVKQSIALAAREKWFDDGLVPTWLTDYSVPGFPLVIEHQRVPFVTLRGEWSIEGLRRAALCILRVSAALTRSGMCLKDAHPWNVLFDGTKPLFIDWGSIRPAEELNWAFWYKQFRQYVLAPLYAFSIGQHRIARAMLREHKVGVGNELVEMPSMANLPDEPRAIAERVNGLPAPSVFESLATYVSELNIPRHEGEWSDYAQPAFSGFEGNESLREKDRIVHRILQDVRCKTMIDIGTNNGLHSEIAASLGKRVLACDIEESCLTTLFTRAEKNRLDVLPLYHDFLWPIGTSGIFNSIPAAEDRLRCDAALVMAVTHHLAFKQHVSFEAMAAGIRRIARETAIVEFVPPDDCHVARWSPEQLPWYSLENFLAAMSGHFQRFQIIPSEPAPRVVVVFTGANQ